MITELIKQAFDSTKAIHDYFGYTQDWAVIPLDDSSEFFWFVDEEDGFVRFAETVEALEDEEEGEYYQNEIYTQCFLPQYVYRANDFTMISVDTHTDGNKFLQIFDNAKEIMNDE